MRNPWNPEGVGRGEALYNRLVFSVHAHMQLLLIGLHSCLHSFGPYETAEHQLSGFSSTQYDPYSRRYSSDRRRFHLRVLRRQPHLCIWRTCTLTSYLPATLITVH